MHAVLFVAMFIAFCLKPKSGQFRTITEQLHLWVSIFYYAVRLGAVFSLVRTQCATSQNGNNWVVLAQFFFFYNLQTKKEGQISILTQYPLSELAESELSCQKTSKESEKTNTG